MRPPQAHAKGMRRMRGGWGADILDLPDDQQAVVDDATEHRVLLVQPVRLRTRQEELRSPGHPEVTPRYASRQGTVTRVSMLTDSMAR